MPTSLVGHCVHRIVRIVSGKPLRRAKAQGSRLEGLLHLGIANRLLREIGMRSTMRHSFEALTPFLMLTGVFVVGLAVAAILARIVGSIVLYILHAF
jgi:hypothetical protein